MTGGAVGDYEELRLGVVMTGGVSLAIWMGGATLEIEALRSSWPVPAGAPVDRHREVYGQLLELTATKVRIDVISGTSAGGLNGALLAAAIAYGSPLDTLRDLWMRCGSFNRLFRKPTRKDPPSILQGDEYLLVKLEETLDHMRQVGTRQLEPGELNDDPPVPSLFMTTALVDGEPLQFFDDFGSELLERTHLGLFNFEAADFAAPEATQRLALAARCSSAHPGGFEASLAPIEKALGRGSPSQRRLHPAMGSVAQWRDTQFTLDGGLLLNKPVQPALDAIFAQPAGAEDIRRLLLLVVPEPADAPENVSDDGSPPSALSLDKRPTILETLSRTNSIPHQQSLADVLVAIRNNHIRVRRERLLREWILRSSSHRTVRAQPRLFEAYRRLEIDQQVAERLGWLERPPHCPILSSTVDSRDHLEAAFAGLLEHRLPRDVSASPGKWQWGRPAAEQLTVMVLDLLRSGLRLTPPGGPPPRAADVNHAADSVTAEQEHHDAWARIGELRQRLLIQRGEASHVLAKMRQLQSWQEEFWRSQAGLESASPTQAWVEDRDRSWRRELSRLSAAAGVALSDDPEAHPEEQLLGQLVDEVVEVMAAGLPTLWELAPQVESLAQRRGEVAERKRALAENAPAGDSSPSVRLWIPTERDEADALSLKEQLSGLVGVPATAQDPPIVTPERWLELMVRLLVEQAPLLASDRVNEQALGLVQLSAEAQGLLDRRKSPAEKLTGLQLAHFGAFYKESWRANDWMWGRHDAALHLVRVLLAPRRLQKLGLSQKEAFEAIQRIALGTPCSRHGEEEARWAGEDQRDQDWLRDHHGDSADKAKKELLFLDQAVEAVPRSLPHCTAWVARRLQLSVAAEELPEVAAAIRRDLADGSRKTPRSDDFLAQYERSKPTDESRFATAARLLHHCRVSDDSLGEEMGSDLFTRTATTGAAVAMAAVHGTKSGLGLLRGITGPLRATLLSVWLAANSAIETHKVTFGLVAFATGIGAAALSIDLVSGFDLPPLWRTLIAALLLALVAVAMLRSRAATLPMAGVAALVVIGAGVALALDVEVTWGFVLAGAILLVFVTALVPPRKGWLNLLPGLIALAGIVAYLMWPVRLSGTGEGCSASPGKAMLTWAQDLGEASDKGSPCDRGIRDWGRNNILLFGSLATGGIVALGIRSANKDKGTKQKAQ